MGERVLSLFEANLDKRVNGADGDQTTQASNSALNKCVGLSASPSPSLRATRQLPKEGRA